MQTKHTKTAQVSVERPPEAAAYAGFGPEEIPSARAMLFSAGVLLIAFAIVASAVYGLAQSKFWDVAPVVLKRGLER